MTYLWSVCLCSAHRSARSAVVVRLESSVPQLEATVAIAALKKLDAGPAMPAFFRPTLTTVAVKNLLPNFPHKPLTQPNTDAEADNRVYDYEVQRVCTRCCYNQLNILRFDKVSYINIIHHKIQHTRIAAHLRITIWQ